VSTGPIFAATPLHGACLTPATLDTSLTAPTHVATLVAPQTNGCKIEQIRFMQVATLASAAIVNVFLYDGTSYWLLEQYTDTFTTSLSPTLETNPYDIYYQNLVLPPGSSLVVTTTTASGQSAHVVQAFGGAY
jgi:hypothetical protein